MTENPDPTKPGWRIGVDIGGTFTDISLVGDDGRVELWKEDSTKDEPERAIQQGLAAVAESLGLSLGELLGRTRLLVHGSTIATNAVLERNGPVVGVVGTEGFRDVLLLRDGFKWDRFNDRLPRPQDFADRRRRLGVKERIGSDGVVRQELDEDSVRDVARRLRDLRVEAIAVSLLWSSANDAHERRVAELLREELGDAIPVMLSSEVLPEVGEWVRTSATVLSAYVYPGSARYLRELSGWLRDNGLGRDVLIMQVNGGCATVERTLKAPVGIVTSGPAAAPAAARHLGARVGSEDLITVDMGGTSFDVCLISGGEPPLKRSIQIEHQPIGVQAVEIHTVGAGGGSIAWIDSGGALRVGPESAGARPGPAAYGHGGEQPTVTDANIVLGYLSPDAFLGGRRQLRADLAAAAIERHVAAPLGLDLVTAAAGIIEVVEANMVDAIRVVSVQRGVDPRPFLLVAGGGAGPLHAGRLAAELGMERVLIPAEAGTICAFGMTVTDVRHDYAAMLHTNSTAPALADIEAALNKLEQRAIDDLTSSGFDPEMITLARTVDARYEGQVHDLSIPLAAGPITAASIEALTSAFHAAHEDRYSWSIAGHPVEFLHWRVKGLGLIQRQDLPMFGDVETAESSASQIGTRTAYIPERGGMVPVSVHASDRFDPGAALSGPAIVESPTTTIMVGDRQRLVADGSGSFLLDVAVEAGDPHGDSAIDVGVAR